MDRIFKVMAVIGLICWAYLLGSWQVNPTEEVAVVTPAEFVAKDPSLAKSELATISLFEAAAPAVVFITTTTLRRDFWSMRAMEIPQGTGSGFFWDREGHIVTNYHVVQGARRIKVTLADQSQYDADYVGGEPGKDLAVLKLKNLDINKIHPLPIGDSNKLRVGQSTFAIGNPFGLDHTLTTGIVSALGREIESVSGVPIKDVIQTDAAINPGNSGGPLLNSSGELIGVNTAIYSPSGAYAGIGFSIPVDVLEWVVPELIKYGAVRRADLGIKLVPDRIQQRLGIKSGLLILQVTPGGVAEKAGLKPTLQNRYGEIILGDVITKIGNQAVNSSSDLQLALESFKDGDNVSLQYVRNGQPETISIPISIR